MPPTTAPPPAVLCISGHDPVGGAGLQADIETLAALGCHAVTAVSCLTVQDTVDVRQVAPVATGLLAAQLEAIRDDLPIAAVKIGLLGDPALAAVVSAALTEIPAPVVLDPVLAAGGGTDLAAAGLIQALRALLPQVDLLTPNHAEALRLTGATDPEAAAAALLAGGCGAVLLTGADAATGGEVVNRLFRPDRPARDFAWPRLPDSYHGSGCTLASACAARLALGDELEAAVEAAQDYTWRALRQAHRPGRGQALPRRISP
jgi:hydroxymethylpyrimidine/phosphomethylpyrimidine kinase